MKLAEKPVRLMRPKAARAFAERLTQFTSQSNRAFDPYHRLEHFQTHHPVRVYDRLTLLGLFGKNDVSKYKSNSATTDGYGQERRDSWRFVSVNEGKLLRRCLILKG